MISLTSLMSLSHEMASAWNTVLPQGCRCCQLSDLVKRNDREEIQKILNNKAEKPCLKELNNALLTAAELGRQDVLWPLLNAGANINVHDTSGCTPVLLASLNNHTDCVRTLLNHISCKLLSLDLRSRTALHHAAATDNMELLELLIDSGADVSACNECKDTPLMVAIVYNNSRIIDRLITDTKLTVENSHGKTVLHKAVEFGDLELVRKLISRGMDVSALNSYMESPLHMACEMGNLDMCRELLNNGALLEVATRRYPSMTPLMMATSKGHLDVVKLLISQGAQLESDSLKMKVSLLCLAAQSGNADLVKYLLEAGVNRKHCQDPDMSAILVASKAGNVDCVKVLLEAGFSASEENIVGWSPLRYAAKGGYTDVVKMLLDHDPEGTKGTIDLAIREALQGGHKDCARVLLEYKAGSDEEEPQHFVKYLTWAAACSDPFMVEMVYQMMSVEDQDSMGSHCDQDPLSVAIEEDHVNTVHKLLELGVPPEGLVEYGEDLTPLHVAIKRGNLNLVRLLLEKGANASGHTYQKISPLMVAIYEKNIAMVDILLKHNTDVNFKFTQAEDDYEAACIDEVVDGVRERMLNHDMLSISALDLAMTNGDPEVVQKLVMHTTTDISPLLVKRSPWNFTINGQPEFKAWLEEENMKPKCLKTICRSAILASLRKLCISWYSMKARIEKLSLPKMLQAYLGVPYQFDSIIEGLCEDGDWYDEEDEDSYPGMWGYSYTDDSDCYPDGGYDDYDVDDASEHS